MIFCPAANWTIFVEFTLSQMPGFFAEFTLSGNTGILRFAQNDKLADKM